MWAHSVSKDMINWISLEPGNVPSKSFDKYGCWSGSATILTGNKPVILYTGIIAKNPKPGYQVQNYAIPANYSDPFLKEWNKPDDNPIVKPTHENVSSFRDPTTAWFNNGHWKMIVGIITEVLHICIGVGILLSGKKPSILFMTNLVRVCGNAQTFTLYRLVSRTG